MNTEPSEPAETSEPTPPHPAEALIAAMEKLEEGEKGWAPKIRTLLITLAFFFFCGLLESSLTDVLILIGVLFFHELGHYLGMRIFDYRNVTMFFVPFLGAAVSGQKTHVEGWKQAVVCLMGPLPGIFVGLALAGWYLVHPDPLLWKFVTIFILLNASQLLPIYPLDGGRFLNEVVFVRSRHLETAFRAVAGCLLLLGAWALGAWVLGVIGFFVLTSAPYAWRVGMLAQDLQDLGLAPEGQPEEKMPIEVAYVMLPELRRAFPHADAGGLATHAKAVWEKVNARPPGLGASVGLMALYGGTVVMLVVALFVFVFANARSWNTAMEQGTRAYNEKRFEEAEKHYRKAQRLAEGFVKVDTRRADMLVALGKTLEKLNQDRDAEKFLREGLRIREEALGPDHPEVADALVGLHEVVRKDPARTEEADALFERISSILIKQLPNDIQGKRSAPKAESEGKSPTAPTRTP